MHEPSSQDRGSLPPFWVCLQCLATNDLEAANCSACFRANSTFIIDPTYKYCPNCHEKTNLSSHYCAKTYCSVLRKLLDFVSSLWYADTYFNVALRSLNFVR